jgi:uncharacterized protein
MALMSWGDGITSYYYQQDPKVTCPSVTLQVTNNCCLRCSYCYQHEKSNKYMSVDTAKKCIDLLFKMYQEDREEAFINHHTKGIILEFIGGEPFLNIDTISAASEYFLQKAYQENLDWLLNSRFSITSNGVLYFEPKVQEYLHKYSDRVSLTITVDGPQELHDACRVDAEGHGSFEKAFAAWKDVRDKYHDSSTKITIAPENLPYLKQIFSFFIQEGCTTIDANPIFEHKWTVEEAKLYYQQLIALADELLNHPEVSSTLFRPYQGPLSSLDNQNWCGGTGKMLAFDPDGLAYPCLRYMPDSLGKERKPIVVGDYNAIYDTPERQQLYVDFLQIDRRSQSIDECWNCPVAQGCSWCSAYNYQEAGTPNKRSTNICWMHRANFLANVYYWNLSYIRGHSRIIIPMYLPREIATQLITNSHYDELLDYYKQAMDLISTACI